MEALLKFLPSPGQPLTIRYGVTVALVAVFYLFSVAAGTTQGPYPFALLPAVVLAAVLFDRGSGLLATALSVIAGATLMNWRGNVISVLAVLTFFAILAAFVALFCEALRTALERGAAAQEELRLLSAEQRHRTKNDLALLSSMIRLQARTQSSPQVRAALEGGCRAIAHHCNRPRQVPIFGE